MRAGTAFSAELANGLDEKTTIHWHGLHVDWRMDGHPLLPVSPGATYRYAYPVEDRGGTYWYHPHAHGTSARQTYSGLAGFFVVEDEEERRLSEDLDLELGETDIPLLIQDKMLDEEGNFIYAPQPMDEEMGYEGDIVLTNLTPNPYLEIGPRIYRFRLLNGSNARNLRLAFSKAGEDELLPYHVIATDGSLLEKPRPATEAFLSPAERMDVLVDLSGFEVGEVVVLKSLSFDPMHNEHGVRNLAGHMDHRDMEHHHHMDHHMDHHMGPARLPDEREIVYVLRLVVEERVEYTGARTGDPIRASATGLHRGDYPIRYALDGPRGRGQRVAHQWPHTRYGRIPHRGEEGNEGGLGGP